MPNKKSYLHLQTGETFQGKSPTFQSEVQGEVVFNTSMVGYPEAMTDPSYKNQILVFTYPLIGNYGVPNIKQLESKQIQVRGIVVSTKCDFDYHHNSEKNLHKWLRRYKVPVIFGVDTRKLTKILREGGVRDGKISFDKKEDVNKNNYENLVEEVSAEEYELLTDHGEKDIMVVDCGIKDNIIRHLKNYPYRIHRVPYDYDFSRIIDDIDGVFISNGPGDPSDCKETVKNLAEIMNGQTPIFGICLGAQLLALAGGAETYKLKYGHRGQNQPCQDLLTKRCYLTSQNHGYAIKEGTLDEQWEITFRNLNDGTIEGIEHKRKPIFAVQFHPEAAPGPTDTSWLFDKFYQQITGKNETRSTREGVDIGLRRITDRSSR